MKIDHVSGWAQKHRHTGGGFSLMEINLAVLMIAVGLLSLFALFPMGLRESEMSIVETQESMFADGVMSAMQGNAMMIDDPADWDDMTQFKLLIKKDVYPIATMGWSRTTQGQGVEFPPNVIDPNALDRYIRYDATIVDNGGRKSLVLSVKSGQYGDFNDTAHIFFTDFIFLGM